ncbi:MAG: GTP-binding protein [Chloroflexi bacterium]|nr:GTP-binding protein [Chloroflexota bacterium]
MPTPETISQIPITILTGFLGAGKTTLLNRILNGDHGLRIAVLVNDFGEINIDSQLVVDSAGADDTITLSNGCICCTIRGDLVNATVDLLNRDIPPEYIIVETSGVSDPLEVALTFTDSKLNQYVAIDSILTVIDGEQFMALDRQYDFLKMNQVGMADIVIINKVDLLDEQTLQGLRDYIYSVMRDARILETTHGDVPLQLLLGIGHYRPERLASRAPSEIHVHAEGKPHDHAHSDHSQVFSTWSWQTDEPLSLKALQRATKALPASIYRAKGILYIKDSPNKQGVLQVVGRRVELSLDGKPWGETAPYTQIVAIGSYGSINPIALQQLFEATLASNAPRSELERISRAVLGWLRPGSDGS